MACRPLKHGEVHEADRKPVLLRAVGDDVVPDLFGEWRTAWRANRRVQRAEEEEEGKSSLTRTLRNFQTFSPSLAQRPSRKTFLCSSSTSA